MGRRVSVVMLSSGKTFLIFLPSTSMASYPVIMPAERLKEEMRPWESTVMMPVAISSKICLYSRASRSRSREVLESSASALRRRSEIMKLNIATRKKVRPRMEKECMAT